ncbi:MAG: TenA family transcriptional regulator, partial [Candidatus Rokuibacteriota bacterium]
MALTAREFGESLMAEVRAGRSFGGHPLWFKIQEGRLSRQGLQGFARQFFLQVVEFPRAVSALHSRCADLGERKKLAESVYEEETGKLSGSKPHPELFIDFAVGVGLRREEVLAAEPLPSTAALIHWFEFSTKILSFLEGVAAINLAAEGQVVGAFGPFARALQKHYGL